MNDITKNEMLFVLNIFKSPEKEYNANNMAEHLGISSMGALKIARRLEEENILISRQIGKAKIYKVNLKYEYVKQYLKFLLKREAEQSPAYVKMWINEIKKIKNADAAILFGSALRKKEAKDIDALIITDQKRFSKVREEIENINLINIKKLHPMYQSEEDFIENIKKEDKPLLNAIKGIIAFGEDKIINLMEK
jgi:predicted nucleotidyltransferase